jgi:hypothetical protein
MAATLAWGVRATTDDGPKEELLNRGHVPVSGDVAYLHTQRAVHFIDFGTRSCHTGALVKELESTVLVWSWSAITHTQRMRATRCTIV